MSDGGAGEAVGAERQAGGALPERAVGAVPDGGAGEAVGAEEGTRTRVVLHTGKGGVGKTTVSAATAVAIARTGRRVLVLSTDPAHSLADVLGCAVGATAAEVPGVKNLLAAQVDTVAAYQGAWSAIRNYLVSVLAARGMADVQAEELLTLPGADELVALLAVHHHARSADVDAVVVDCAPTGDTLRLLALPETMDFYAGRMVGTPARLLRAVAASLTGVAAPPAPVRDAMGELLADLGRVRTMLADPATTAVRLVLTPESVVLAEARRLRTALALHGFGVDAVLVNRILPDGVRGEFLDGWRAAQSPVLADVEDAFGDLPVYRMPLMPGEPVGMVALASLATELFGDGDPLPERRRSPVMAVTAVSDAGYRLSLPLPYAQQGSLALARSGDDLVITLGSQRRRLALPAVLRRCTVTAARISQAAGTDPAPAGGRATTLLVDFAPDPARWPKALAGRLRGDDTDGSGRAEPGTRRQDQPMAAAR